MIDLRRLRLWVLCFIGIFLLSATTPVASEAASSPTQLVFFVAPSSSAQSGSPLASQPVIDIEDSGGNLVTSASGSVSASIQPFMQGTTLVNGTANVVNGVATFSNLTIDALSGSYTVMFTYDSLSISWGPVAVIGGVCGGCVVPPPPVPSYSTSFGPFAIGSSHLSNRVLTQLRRLIKIVKKDMSRGFTSTAELTIRVYGYSGVDEPPGQPEKLAHLRAYVVKAWIEPRIRSIDRSSMPVRYLISREDVRSNFAASRTVKVILKLGA